MVRTWVFVGGLLGLLGAVGCDGGDGGDADGTGDSGDGAGLTATCTNVLLTERIADASGTLDMTVDGASQSASLDPSAVYASNPVWDSGAAPAACGRVDGGDLTTVLQLEDAGTPVLRLQLLGAPAGDYDLDGGTPPTGLTGFVLDEDAPDSRRALSFRTGTVAIAPDPLAADTEITLTFDATGGDAIGGDTLPFTLDGTLTMTVPGGG